MTAEIITGKIMKKKSKKKVLKHNNSSGHQLVFQHNNLVEARYDLTLQEKRMILIALSKIKPEDIKLGYVSFDVRELCDLCGIVGESAYSELKKVTKRLRERTIEITDLDQKTLTQIGWVDRIVYRNKEGCVDIRFHELLEKFLIELQANFTAIPLSQTLGLSSAYAIRLFELLKQYERIGRREISVEELRSNLGLSKNILIKYNDFKKCVLDISIREINTKTDMFVEFAEIKSSRKITDLIFQIRKNNLLQLEQKKEAKKQLENIIGETKEGMTKRLIELGFSRGTIKKFFEQYEEVKILKALGVVKDQVLKGLANNPKALFRSALANNWAIDKYSQKKIKQ